jgi:hypothetical protein
MGRWAGETSVMTDGYRIAAWNAACSAVPPEVADMKRNTTNLALGAALILTGCSAASPSDDGPSAETRASALQAQVIWFGDYEVLEGHLKSANGALPKAGTTVTLELFLDQLSDVMCRFYCAAIGPHVFVRFNGTSAFTELPDVPRGYVPPAGGAAWDVTQSPYHYDAPLAIPAGSDRIETYIYWDRVSFTCVLESDETCTVNGPIDGAYLSNYGKSFSIPVTP